MSTTRYVPSACSVTSGRVDVQSGAHACCRGGWCVHWEGRPIIVAISASQMLKIPICPATACEFELSDKV
jgi:hypothetical protein